MSNRFYDNKVLENQYDSILNTQLELNPFMTIDNLPEGQGLVKRIIVYKATGEVDDLVAGADNTHSVEIGYTTKDYQVMTTQGRFIYRDEDAQQDGIAIENGLKGLAETMQNNWNDKAIDEWEKATLQQTYSSSIDYNTVIDALGQLKLENESSLFMLISLGAREAFRKNLKDSLQYVEAFVRTGYIGSVAGVNVYACKAIPDGEAIIATKEAVRAFIAPATEIEQSRVAGTRTNTVYARRLSVIALVDQKKVCHIGKVLATPLTCTTYTASAKTIAGACSTGAEVWATVNGKETGSHVSATNNAYTITATDNLVSGDKVVVYCKLDGFAQAPVEKTVS